MVPTGAQALTEAAQRLDPEAIVQEQGCDGLGHPEFVRFSLAAVSAKHDLLV